MTPTARHQVAQELVAHGLSRRRACQVVLAHNGYGIVGRAATHLAADAPVTAVLQALVARHPGWGFWKYHYRLRENGLVISHKRLWRLYQALGLQLGKPAQETTLARPAQTAAPSASCARRLLVARLHG